MVPVYFCCVYLYLLIVISASHLHLQTKALDADTLDSSSIASAIDPLHSFINLNDIHSQALHHNRSKYFPIDVFANGLVDSEDYDPHHAEARRLDSTSLSDPSLIINQIPIDNTFTITYDPPLKTFSPTGLGVFVFCPRDPSCKIYYTQSTYYQIGVKAPIITYPTLESSYATQSQPYIHMETPYLASRNRTLIMVAVYSDALGKIWRSKQYELPYFIEASNRPKAAMFLVPGIESKGNFLRVELEVKAKARAQTAGGQEFSDFFTKLGVGPYDNQVQSLHLPSLDPDFNGYEGGVSYISADKQHFGIIGPYHNGHNFHGNIIRINLKQMSNATKCMSNYQIESLYPISQYYPTSLPYNATHRVRIQRGNNAITRDNACVLVLKLQDINPRARGFQRVFMQYPYVHLAPGEFDVPVRINVEKFGLNFVQLVDLEAIVPELGLGGYSGGFVDKSWTCYVPMRTFFGPVGGLRSKLPVDRFHLRPYYHGRVLCLNDTAFNNASRGVVLKAIRTIELTDFSPELRGFSDGVRVGRYAYLSPYSYDAHAYTGKVIRIDLGYIDIAHTIDSIKTAGLPIGTMLNMLDLAKIDPVLMGFGGIFTAGRYVYLVPSRNKYEPQNGNRGHGNFVRINMNEFNLKGVEFIDIPTTTRTQIPSFADTDLRGFSYGFPSGKYGVLVPFFNSVFSGKCARLVIFGQEGLADNLQELDLVQDYYGRIRQKNGECGKCDRSFLFKGYRGGFASLWPGVEY